MGSDILYKKYHSLFLSLRDIIRDSQKRVLEDPPDKLFSENVNFFTKSYLINVCTYLEAFLQELAFDIAEEICKRVNSAKIPHNFLYWKTAKEIREKELNYREAYFSLTKKEISDELSANPYRTIKLFKFLGINLESEPGFKDGKEVVGSVVNKRNNIIHHNDMANDISLSDIDSYIDLFIDYMSAISRATSRHRL
ncbi:TPA: HEPN domain-containing protein [Pseudomonas aeruginosa]|uniref:HEPN domain-containing protein n=1 Tax=Pseudomonas aeruginosa TaxID=287 RepID=UPI001F4A338E|nr:HEPN domain-containing protein [Pseudomonas aeruginosa]EKX8710202.1 hypothetical protein [Pseudomonas aeruginosa]HBO5985368.1 hypothetical protein [Pseudomonas aeruginosa]HCF2949926.1 hypothetical protein [Pseudomonas aeruginosa]HEP9006315.1 hypothetical protein [Pseudomonas aeruginosa]HEQ0128533.1 hypothetical protein [Pseudomonas aeruginosa]